MSPGVPISSHAAPSVEQHSLFAASRWSGHIPVALVVLLVFSDAITNGMKVSAVLAASARLGLSENLIVAIGIILLACAILYLIPCTSILGAVLLTGYLGGGVSTQRRVGKSALSPNVVSGLFWRARVAWTVSPCGPLARAGSLAKLI